MKWFEIMLAEQYTQLYFTVTYLSS